MIIGLIYTYLVANAGSGERMRDVEAGVEFELRILKMIQTIRAANLCLGKF
jgi:hypothetical protein